MKPNKAEILIGILLLCLILTFLAFIGSENKWQSKVSLLNNEIEKIRNESDEMYNNPSNQYYKLISKYNNKLITCRFTNCLFQDNKINSPYVFGLATLKGFFTTTLKKDWGDTDVECDSFVITDGTYELVQSYLDIIKRGGAMNSINENGQPIININLTEIPDILKKKIVSSNEDSPAELTVFQNPPTGKGAGVCYNSIHIIEVK